MSPELTKNDLVALLKFLQDQQFPDENESPFFEQAIEKLKAQLRLKQDWN
jgi:hypothetical protein